MSTSRMIAHLGFPDEQLHRTGVDALISADPVVGTDPLSGM
jgi:hypothetical protein